MIRRDRERAMIAGVCAGIGRRYGISPAVVRTCWVAGTVLTSGVGLLLYGIVVLMTPGQAVGAAGVDGADVGGGARERRPAESPGRGATQLLAALLWLFLILLVVQVYLAGAFLLGGIDGRAAHQALGYVMVYYYPLMVIVIALVAGAPWRFWLAGAVFLVLLIAQPVLVHMSAADGAGWMRALHAPNALLLVLLVCYLLRVVRTPHPCGRASEARQPGASSTTAS